MISFSSHNLEKKDTTSAIKDNNVWMPLLHANEYHTNRLWKTHWISESIYLLYIVQSTCKQKPLKPLVLAVYTVCDHYTLLEMDMRNFLKVLLPMYSSISSIFSEDTVTNPHQQIESHIFFENKFFFISTLSAIYSIAFFAWPCNLQHAGQLYIYDFIYGKLFELNCEQ